MRKRASTNLRVPEFLRISHHLKQKVSQKEKNTRLDGNSKLEAAKNFFDVGAQIIERKLKCTAQIHPIFFSVEIDFKPLNFRTLPNVVPVARSKMLPHRRSRRTQNMSWDAPVRKAAQK